MRILQNANHPPEGFVQKFIGSAYDSVKLVSDNLDPLLVIAEAIAAGDFDDLLKSTDIDTMAELNAIITDGTLTDILAQATADQGVLADNSMQLPIASAGEAVDGTDNERPMTALRVAQAIEAQADTKQNNYIATTDPSATDDTNVGYSVGSVWVNTTTDEAYRCADAAAGAAIWILSTLTSDELAIVALTGNSDDLIEGVTKLLLTVAERSKLLGIEAGATADQTPTEIEAAYEGIADTNKYTDAEKTKLTGIESLATGDQSAAEIEAGYNTQVAAASTLEMEAGTEVAIRRMSPLRVAEAIVALGGGGGIEEAPEDSTPYSRQDAGWVSSPSGGGGGGGMNALYKASNYTLLSNDKVYSEAGLTHTLPATPVEGDVCSVWDVSDDAGNNQITIESTLSLYDPGMMTFNGTDAYYSKQYNNNATAFTLVQRFNIASFTGGADVRLFDLRGGTGSQVFCIIFVFPSDYTDTELRNKVKVLVQNGSTTIAELISDVDVADGNDKLLFFSYENAGNATFYIDGVDADDTGFSSRVLIAGTLPVHTGGTPNMNVGASNGGALPVTGDIGYFGFREAYLTNPTDFGTGAAPAELDESGWAEWGAQPEFWNEFGTMTDNKGSAGNMIANGTITGPSVPAVPATNIWNLNMNGGRFDFMYDGSEWIYSYVVQTIQPSTTVSKTSSFLLTAEAELRNEGTNGAVQSWKIFDQYDFETYVYAMNGNYSGRLSGMTKMPTDWDGVSVRARIIWSPSSTNVGDVYFSNRFAAMNDGDATPTPNQMVVGCNDVSNGVTNSMQVSPWSSWAAGGGWTSDTIFGFYSQRVDTAGFTGSAKVLAVEIEYTITETLTAAVSNNPNRVSRDLTGTVEPLLASDAGMVLYCSNALAQDIQIPDGLPEGFQCIIAWEGVGQPSFSMVGAETSVGVNTPTAQYGRIHVEKRNGSVWWGTG